MCLAHERRQQILGFLALLRKEWEVAQAEDARQEGANSLCAAPAMPRHTAAHTQT